MLNQTGDPANKGATAWSSGLLIVAGLLGGAGVAAAALAAHGKGGPDLSIAAQFLILHAAAICALAMPGPKARLSFLGSATLLALGALLFCGDLSSRGLLGARLFPMAAPSGGVLLIAGWLALSLAAALNLARSGG